MALRAMWNMVMMVTAWCVVGVGVMVMIGTMATLVRITLTKAREEQWQCDVISSM